MPRTAEDIETFLINLDRRFDADGGTFFIYSSADKPPVALRVAPPIVAIRADIGQLPTDDAQQLALFRRLLQFNADDLMHSAYGLEENTIVLSAALALENVDQNEIEAVLSDIDLALARHVPELHKLAQA